MKKLHRIHKKIVEEISANVKDIHKVKEILKLIEEYVIENKFHFMEYIKTNEPGEFTVDTKEKLSNEIGEIQHKTLIMSELEKEKDRQNIIVKDECRKLAQQLKELENE